MFLINGHSLTEHRLPALLQAAVLAGVGIGIALVIFGWILVPATNLFSIGAALTILAIYGLLGRFFPARLYRLNPHILQLAIGFGLCAGVVFVSEMLWEYLALPADNSTLELLEFGSVFGLYLLAGLLIGQRTRQIRQAVLTAASSAMIGSLIWLIAMLVIFYAFRGSLRQVHVFQIEGNYQDFARSGMDDFDALVMEDFMGAGFFHLLLGPLVAIILGVLGGLLGKALARIHRQLCK
jgi:hypothetical protein